MRIELVESGLSVCTLNAHSLNPDPIWINPNPLPEVVLNWIVQLRVAQKDQIGVACMLMLTTDSECASPGYTLCSMYLLNSRINMMAG